ncbi:DNA-binding transcriptional activator PunR [Dongshaea marina]|uniref:DNA-binding transcriptional activator PunR n=1 Tax=Dongshaea marina TaxID=2047966 RepID=UPI000D3E3793|nr:DNA-binding transcriptional activator PunR [Dongshaea marina]
MFSRNDLRVIDTVARCGSFTAAAQELHRVPSAVSYTVRQVEQQLAVKLFERQSKSVSLTAAGEYFVQEARLILKQMNAIRHQTQRVAHGWQQSLSVALDNVVRSERVSTLVRDFYQAYPDVELLISMEVYNGVWEALADNRADIAIGATMAIPVGGGVSYREMGRLDWSFVVSPTHPLAFYQRPLRDEEVREYPSITLEDTSRYLPKRTTWLLDNQRRLVVPNWHCAIDCFCAGLGIGVMPKHIAEPLIRRGELIEKTLENPRSASHCCVGWHAERTSPPLEWLLEYLGDPHKLQQQWLR